jgi:proteasome accessory factor A
VQWELYALADDFCRRGDHADLDPATEELLDEWRHVLEGLERDPDGLADRIDWIAKRSLMEGFVRRDGLSWDSPRLQLIDLQYSDIRPDRGLAARLEERGRLRRMFTDEQVAAAVDAAPEDTRAYFRGECIRRYPDAIAAASWDSVVFDVPGRESLLRVPTLEPLRGTRAHVEGLLDASPDVATLIDRLTPQGSR